MFVGLDPAVTLDLNSAARQPHGPERGGHIRRPHGPAVGLRVWSGAGVGIVGVGAPRRTLVSRVLAVDRSRPDLRKVWAAFRDERQQPFKYMGCRLAVPSNMLLG